MNRGARKVPNAHALSGSPGSGRSVKYAVDETRNVRPTDLRRRLPRQRVDP